jgi:hypothetical protein
VLTPAELHALAAGLDRASRRMQGEATGPGPACD